MLLASFKVGLEESSYLKSCQNKTLAASNHSYRQLQVMRLKYYGSWL